MAFEIAIYIVIFIILLYILANLVGKRRDCYETQPLQDAAGFGMEKYPRNYDAIVNVIPPYKSVEGADETSLDDPRMNNAATTSMVEGDHNLVESNETESGRLISPTADWQQAIQDISLEPSVVDSHKRYVEGESVYLNRGAAAPNLPIREDDQTINGFVGLTGAIYARGMVKPGARTVPSENYDQLRKGTQLRWRTGNYA